MVGGMSKSATEIVIADRIAGLGAWIEDEAPYARFDQRHLDRGTPERAYWHLGYLAALQDALALVRGEKESSADSANPNRAADPGA
jgi:hypothetical protein